MDWVNAIVQGVLLGGLYALFAAGLSLIFGVMLQNDKAERLYVGAVGHDIATLRADKKTSALEAMDKAFGFEA